MNRREISLFSGADMMKSAGILIGFLPLILYGILSGPTTQSVEIALVVSLAASIVTGLSDLRNGFLIAWINLVFFLIALVLIVFFGLTSLIPFLWVLLYATFTVMTFASILVRSPFTLQYARKMVEPELWGNPVFIRVNDFMTGVWGCLFGINFVLSVISLNNPALQAPLQLTTYSVLIGGVAFSVLFPGYIRKKRSGRIAGPDGSIGPEDQPGPSEDL